MSDIRCPLCQQKNKALDSPKIPKSLKKFQNFPLATPLITWALLLRSGVSFGEQSLYLDVEQREYPLEILRHRGGKFHHLSVFRVGQGKFPRMKQLTFNSRKIGVTSV